MRFPKMPGTIKFATITRRTPPFDWEMAYACCERVLNSQVRYEAPDSCTCKRRKLEPCPNRVLAATKAMDNLS
jgi:hypothetical protein